MVEQVYHLVEVFNKVGYHLIQIPSYRVQSVVAEKIGSRNSFLHQIRIIMSSKEKYEDLLDKLKNVLSELKTIYNPDLDFPVSQLEHAVDELGRIPKDDKYWEDFD